MKTLKSLDIAVVVYVLKNDDNYYTIHFYDNNISEEDISIHLSNEYQGFEGIETILR